MVEKWKWLNPASSKVWEALAEYKSENKIPQWEQLAPEKVLEFELFFAKEYILGRRRQGYPFFLNPGSLEVAKAMEAYSDRHSIPHGCPWPDAVRDEFEMEFAAERLGIAWEKKKWNWNKWIRNRLKQARKEKKRRAINECSSRKVESTPEQK